MRTRTVCTATGVAAVLCFVLQLNAVRVALQLLWRLLLLLLLLPLCLKYCIIAAGGLYSIRARRPGSLWREDIGVDLGSKRSSGLEVASAVCTRTTLEERVRCSVRAASQKERNICRAAPKTITDN